MWAGLLLRDSGDMFPGPFQLPEVPGDPSNDITLTSDSTVTSSLDADLPSQGPSGDNGPPDNQVIPYLRRSARSSLQVPSAIQGDTRTGSGIGT